MTLTVDLHDRVEEIEGYREEIRQEAAEIDPDDRGSAEAKQLEDEYEELGKSLDTLREKIEEYGGSEFEIKEGKWGDQGRINDRVRADTLNDGLDDPRAKEDALRIHTVQVLVCSTPPDAPTEAKEYPPVIGQFLWEKADAYNRLGDVDGGPGNSLWEDLETSTSNKQRDSSTED